MNSDLLKRIAAGEAFDLVEGVREIARALVEQPLASTPQDGASVAKVKITPPRKGTQNRGK